MKTARRGSVLLLTALMFFFLPGYGKENAATIVTPKKGIAAAKYGPANLALADASWYYDWGSSPHSGSVPAGYQPMEFVPMLWGTNFVTDQAVSALTTGKNNGTYHYLLGFNEPDLGSQANMTVAQAISLWPKLISTGLILGSPAPSSPGTWLDDFMSQAAANNYRVDFICLHYYAPPNAANAVSALKTFLTNAYNKYQKPIWLTEFGAPDCKTLGWCGSNAAALTQAQVDTFVPQVIAMLEDLSFVQRYAWFVDASQAGFELSALFTSAGALSQTGIDFRDAHGSSTVQWGRVVSGTCLTPYVFYSRADGRLAFRLPPTATQYRVSVSDASGRFMYGASGIGSGEQIIPQNKGNWSGGVYVGRVDALGLVRTERIVVW
ncbi:MAG TPA: glycoside hydrolase family protein [Chitinivibrionales bacterium]|nr:glycoside hydrolase family protein [Chitinivibrionales bacterium]